jgi:hypothetical protein
MRNRDLTGTENWRGEEEKVGLLANFDTIFNWWKNCFSQQLNVRWISGVRHMEMHTAEALVAEPSP